MVWPVVGIERGEGVDDPPCLLPGQGLDRMPVIRGAMLTTGAGDELAVLGGDDEQAVGVAEGPAPAEVVYESHRGGKQDPARSRHERRDQRVKPAARLLGSIATQAIAAGIG